MKYILSFFLLSFVLVSCTKVTEVDVNGDSAISGKYNTIKVVGDFIYAVTDSELITIDKTDNDNPKEIDRQELGDRIENLYEAENVLFIGSETDMYIFTLASNGIPEMQSETAHIEFSDEVEVCDPVIAKNDIAYVTLSSVQPDNSVPCGGMIEINELRTYNIADLTSPKQVNTVNLDSPQGLSIDGDILFVTNLNGNTNVYDVNHNGGMNLVGVIPGGAHDVIATDGKVLIVSKTEIKQYDYSNIDNIIHYATIKL